MPTLGELKQSICTINNSIHQDLFGVGLKKQSVDFVQNKIVIVDGSARASVLTSLSEKYPSHVAEIDKLLLEEYKRRLKQELTDTLKLDIKAIVKDYDANTEIAGAIVILFHDVADYCC